jgi:acetyl esterase/lipase
MRFPRQVPGIPLRSSHHELREDVVYDEVGGVPLRFDHYRPLGVEGSTPALVMVHGGAWISGDPSQAAGHGLHLARLGIATISISYRLAPVHRFPAPLHDVRRGIRWIRAHADELGVDPDRLVLLGLSAGAHLVALAHLAQGVPALEQELPPALRDVSEDVRGVIAHYGPYDLAHRSPLPDGTDPVVELLGPRADDPEWVALASPIRYATRARAPFQLVHGTADTLVSPRHSERLHAALGAAGKTSELLLLDGAPHAFQIDWQGDSNRRANAAMDALLDRVFAS